MIKLLTSIDIKLCLFVFSCHFRYFILSLLLQQCVDLVLIMFFTDLIVLSSFGSVDLPCRVQKRYTYARKTTRATSLKCYSTKCTALSNIIEQSQLFLSFVSLVALVVIILLLAPDFMALRVILYLVIFTLHSLSLYIFASTNLSFSLLFIECK